MTPNPKTMREILKELLEMKDRTITETISEIKGLMLSEDEIHEVIYQEQNKTNEQLDFDQIAKEIHSAQMEKLK
jgi:Glu-tRNA(Gln) amidotransferase subunit E-like FAD-binding protein